MKNIGRNNKSELQYKIDDGFGIPVDIDQSRKELLLIEVLRNGERNRLVIAPFGKTAVKDLYQSDIIGSVCFLKGGSRR